MYKRSFPWPHLYSFLVVGMVVGAGKVNSKLTPHPTKAFIDPLQLTHAESHRNARTFILCTQANPAWTSVARVRAELDWRYEEIATGHDAMVTAPQALVDILLQCV